MHLKRWLTALVGLPVLIYLIGPGPRWLFYLVLLAAALVALLEFYGITAPDMPRSTRAIGAAAVCAIFAAIYFRQVLLLPALIALTAILPMACRVLGRDQPAPASTAGIGRACLGPLYTGLPLAMLMLIDMRPNGNLWIFFLLTVIFSGDTAAYYIGKAFGRHKLTVRISPGKTREGAVGGLLGSILGGALFLNAFPIHPVNLPALFLAAVLGAAGQVGDLSESLLKRSHGVKDSGAILPGHGGILDRVDALIFAIPVFYVYLCFYV